MKIVITTLGTRGDLQPYIALGIGLKNAGYQVQIVTAKTEKTLVLRYGLDFYGLDVDIMELMEGPEVKAMSKGNNPLRFIISHLGGSRKLRQLMIKIQDEIWKACEDADLAIFHPGMPLAFFWAKEKNKKCVLASTFPVVPTRDYPAVLFYRWPKWGSGYNLLTHAIFDKVFWALAKSAIVAFWKKNIKTGMNFSVSPLRQQVQRRQLVLNGYSRYLFAPSRDWPNNIETTGSWFIESEAEFSPPAELGDFLREGQPPIYIGFGSMKDPDSFTQTFSIIIDALTLTKQRAVVALGWSQNAFTGIIPANIFLTDNVAHSWLFPKMKMVIHHGGAGTTAAGLLAGKPTIVIPHNADQPAWGQRVFELGVGAKPIPKRTLSSKLLAQAIFFCLDDKIRQNAEELARKIKTENGVARATTLIGEVIGLPG